MKSLLLVGTLICSAAPALAMPVEPVMRILEIQAILEDGGFKTGVSLPIDAIVRKAEQTYSVVAGECTYTVYVEHIAPNPPVPSPPQLQAHITASNGNCP